MLVSRNWAKCAFICHFTIYLHLPNGGLVSWAELSQAERSTCFEFVNQPHDKFDFDEDKFSKNKTQISPPTVNR